MDSASAAYQGRCIPGFRVGANIGAPNFLVEKSEPHGHTDSCDTREHILQQFPSFDPVRILPSGSCLVTTGGTAAERERFSEVGSQT